MGTQAKLKALLAQGAKEAFSTRVELARRSDLWSNSLRSFLGHARVAESATIFGAEHAEELFAVPTDEHVIGGQIEDLAKAPHDPTHWAVLHSVIGDGRIPAALRSRFIEVLQTVSFDELARADTKMLGMALIFACDQARAISDERLIRRMGEILMGFAPVAASLANDEKAALPLLLALPNALMSVAVVPGNEAESARRFFDLPSVCGALPTSGSPYLCSVNGVGEAPDIRAAG